MRKTYPLQAEGRHPDRVLDAVKHDVRKYLKRERRRPLPEGVDFWDFDCKVGTTAESVVVVKDSAVVESLDTLAKEGAASVYFEILSKHGIRVIRPENDPVIIERVDDAGFANR